MRPTVVLSVLAPRLSPQPQDTRTSGERSVSTRQSPPPHLWSPSAPSGSAEGALARERQNHHAEDRSVYVPCRSCCAQARRAPPRLARRRSECRSRHGACEHPNKNPERLLPPDLAHLVQQIGLSIVTCEGHGLTLPRGPARGRVARRGRVQQTSWRPRQCMRADFGRGRQGGVRTGEVLYSRKGALSAAVAPRAPSRPRR